MGQDYSMVAMNATSVEVRYAKYFNVYLVINQLKILIFMLVRVFKPLKGMSNYVV